ncbi:Holliday junction branch migration protein RuvA [Candidatus Gracilibacteria bacterium]|nr:MAG: Holliday junction branch migration protein RuvA [Candidatus Gracilibacteria bacterium]
MIAYCSGKVIDIFEQSLTLQIENVGIGLEIFVSPSLQSTLRVGDTAEIWIHHHITEATSMLFGFAHTSERKIFRSLIKVGGIGGKTALNIIALGADNIQKAINTEDDALLSSVPGIGKKTAQKIIVELKGSIQFDEITSKEKPAQISGNNIAIVSSLVQMGYDKRQVEQTVQSLDDTLSTEEKVRQSIKTLSNS